MKSENYRQLLNNERGSLELTAEEYDNTLMHFAELYHKEKQCNIANVMRCASCGNSESFRESPKQEICIEGEYRYVTATVCDECGKAIEIDFFD